MSFNNLFMNDGKSVHTIRNPFFKENTFMITY